MYDKQLNVYLSPGKVGAYGSLKLLIQPWICAPDSHHGWVDQLSAQCLFLPSSLAFANTTILSST